MLHSSIASGEQCILKWCALSGWSNRFWTICWDKAAYAERPAEEQRCSQNWYFISVSIAITARMCTTSVLWLIYLNYYHYLCPKWHVSFLFVCFLYWSVILLFMSLHWLFPTKNYHVRGLQLIELTWLLWFCCSADFFFPLWWKLWNLAQVCDHLLGISLECDSGFLSLTQMAALSLNLLSHTGSFYGT